MKNLKKYFFLNKISTQSIIKKKFYAAKLKFLNLFTIFFLFFFLLIIIKIKIINGHEFMLPLTA